VQTVDMTTLDVISAAPAVVDGRAVVVVTIGAIVVVALVAGKVGPGVVVGPVIGGVVGAGVVVAGVVGIVTHSYC